VDVLLKGLMAQPGVEGFLVFNDAACVAAALSAGRARVPPPPPPPPLLRLQPPTHGLSPPPSSPCARARSRSVPVKWTSSGFIKPGTPNSANPLPPQIVHNTALFSDLGQKARQTCHKLLGDGGDGELTSMRLHTRTSEIVLAPAHECTLVVVQRAHSAESATLVAIAEKAQMQAMEEAAKQPGGKK
jgi:hypothetical protein